MPRREILTSSDRMQLLAFPEDEAELIRRYTLTKADLAFVRQQKRVAASGKEHQEEEVHEMGQSDPRRKSVRLA